MSSTPFYDDNGGRDYPFLVDSTGQTGSGSIDNLPLDTIVDFGCLMGIGSEFDADDDTVYLHRVARAGGLFYFEFRTTAAGLFGTALNFSVSETSTDYLIQYANSGPNLTVLDSDSSVSSSDSSVSSSESECDDEPDWSGYLVTGDLTLLAALLGDGESLRNNEAFTEPTTTQSLIQKFVRSVSLANDDRTRADAPLGCSAITWPHAVGLTFVNKRCLQGQLRLKAGHNAILQQNNLDNALELSAAKNAGAGEVCDQVPVRTGEQDATGRNTFDGSPLCHEVVRSFNGVGSRYLNFTAGQGVTITPVPGSNKLTIDVDLAGLAICYSEESEISDG